jgi:DNA-binding transcriptional MerR regulator
MSMNDRPLLTIDELAGLAGVPIRTVRFYIAEGLLPGASARGKGPSYTQEHLDRLQLIRLLVARHLPLAEIRALLTRLPPGEVRDVVEEEQARTEEVTAQAGKPSSPKDYLSALLEQARGYPTERHPGGLAGGSGAGAQAGYPREVVHQVEPSPLVPKVPMPSVPAPSTPPRRREPALPWHRWELAPGIELQVRADVARQEQHMIERVLNAVRAALASGTANTVDHHQQEGMQNEP